MKLYVLSQDTNNNYDTFDSAVVAAKNETDARNTQVGYASLCNTWVPPDDVTVRRIGTATKGTEAGVIVASFNAG